MDAVWLDDASRRFVLHSLRRDRCLIFERGENARMWDVHGRSYLDTMSGSAGPAMVGHANPRVASAVAEQMARLPTTNLLHESAPVTPDDQFERMLELVGEVTEFIDQRVRPKHGVGV